MCEPCQRVGRVRRGFPWGSLHEPQISGAFRNNVMQKLGCDKNPSASVLRAGEASTLG
jgi:hypothetical protein